MTRPPTHYEVLGLETTAEAAEIRSTYRKISRTAHPDAGGSKALFQILEEAHRILSDPASRAAYDRELADDTGGGVRSEPGPRTEQRARRPEGERRPGGEGNGGPAGDGAFRPPPPGWKESDWESYLWFHHERSGGQTPPGNYPRQERDFRTRYVDPNAAARPSGTKSREELRRARSIRRAESVEARARRRAERGLPPLPKISLASRARASAVLMALIALGGLARLSGLVPALFGAEVGQGLVYGMEYNGPPEAPGASLGNLIFALELFALGMWASGLWWRRATWRPFPTAERVAVVVALGLFLACFEYLLVGIGTVVVAAVVGGYFALVSRRPRPRPAPSSSPAPASPTDPA